METGVAFDVSILNYKHCVNKVQQNLKIIYELRNGLNKEGKDNIENQKEIIKSDHSSLINTKNLLITPLERRNLKNFVETTWKQIAVFDSEQRHKNNFDKIPNAKCNLPEQRKSIMSQSSSRINKLESIIMKKHPNLSSRNLKIKKKYWKFSLRVNW